MGGQKINGSLAWAGSMSPENVMYFGVPALSHHNKILNSIIKLLPVYMMHVFVFSKLSSKMLFSYVSMFVRRFTINRYSPISTFIYSTALILVVSLTRVVLTLTLVATKLIGSIYVFGSCFKYIERLAALYTPQILAFHFDLRTTIFRTSKLLGSFYSILSYIKVTAAYRADQYLTVSIFKAVSTIPALFRAIFSFTVPNVGRNYRVFRATVIAIFSESFPHYLHYTGVGVGVQ